MASDEDGFDSSSSSGFYNSDDGESDKEDDVKDKEEEEKDTEETEKTSDETRQEKQGIYASQSCTGTADSEEQKVAPEVAVPADGTEGILVSNVCESMFVFDSRWMLLCCCFIFVDQGITVYFESRCEGKT